jgi:hypothetical protein
MFFVCFCSVCCLNSRLWSSGSPSFSTRAKQLTSADWLCVKSHSFHCCYVCLMNFYKLHGIYNVIWQDDYKLQFVRICKKIVLTSKHFSGESRKMQDVFFMDGLWLKFEYRAFRYEAEVVTTTIITSYKVWHHGRTKDASWLLPFLNPKLWHETWCGIMAAHN